MPSYSRFCCTFLSPPLLLLSTPSPSSKDFAESEKKVVGRKVLVAGWGGVGWKRSSRRKQQLQMKRPVRLLLPRGEQERKRAESIFFLGD